MPKKNHVAAISLDNSEWLCEIDENPSGVASCRFSPCSRGILIVNTFNTRLTIYSLSAPAKYIILNPKYTHKGLSFAKNTPSMAVLERKDLGDYIGVYSLKWAQEAVF